MTGCGGCSTKGSGGCCQVKNNSISQSSIPTTPPTTSSIRQYDFGNQSNRIVYSNNDEEIENDKRYYQPNIQQPIKSNDSGGCSSGGCSSGGCSTKSTNNTKNNHSKDEIISSESVIIQGDSLQLQGCPSNTSSAGHEPICKSCPGQGVCSSQGENPDKKAIDIRMKVIKNKLLILSGKGGVGKSSISSLISFGLVHRDKKVSILDVDICGPSIPKLMGVEGVPIVNSESGWIPPRPLPECNIHHDGIKVMSVGSMLGNQDNSIVWKGPRKTSTINRLLKDTFWGRQDFLIVDTPPGTGDEHMSIVSALSGATQIDGVIIVTSPQDLSVDTVKREIDFCLKQNLPILGIIENMSGYACPCCDEITEIFKSNGGQKLSDLYNIPLLGKLPIDVNIGYCNENGKCVYCDFPESTGTKSILSIIDLILNKLEKNTI